VKKIILTIGLMLTLMLASVGSMVQDTSAHTGYHTSYFCEQGRLYKTVTYAVQIGSGISGYHSPRGVVSVTAVGWCGWY
jgi:hypothetical protein